MRDYAECKPFLDFIAAEHRQLHQMVQQIGDQLRVPRTAAEVRDLRRDLQELRTRLARHFTEEENEGCLEEARCRCPNLSPQVAQLLAEHPQLLASLDDVLLRTETLLVEVTRAELPLERGEAFQREREIASQFIEFARQLQIHEQSENRVLRLAFGTDPEFEEE